MVDSIKSTKVPAVVAENLRREIVQGRFTPGDRLPSNRDLAVRFSVSAGSVREAIGMLASEGLVETRAGSGTFVAWDAVGAQGAVIDHPLDRKQIEELIETRETLEPRLAALAAQRVSEREIKRLWTILERMQAAASDPRSFAQTDVELHLAIAEAAGNRFLMRTTRDARSLLERDMELSAEVGIRRLGTLQFSIDTHRRLVAAIAAGDAEKAHQTTLNILSRNHEFVLSLYSSEVSVEAAGDL